jgi:hypothetical protein
LLLAQVDVARLGEQVQLARFHDRKLNAAAKA